MATKYIDSLTPLRGIAALWVVVFHIDVSLFYRDLGALLPRSITGIISHGYLWVDFFFILSGFILAHVYGGDLSGPRPLRQSIDYLWARLSRIYPLHLFCFGLCVVIALIYPLIIPNVKDGAWETFMAWRAIPSNLLLTHAMNQHVYLSWDIVSWSIGAEWWTYVVTIPLVIWLHKGPRVIALLMTGVAAASLVGLVYALKDHNLDITFNYGFFRCLAEFIIGLGVYRAYREGWLSQSRHDAVIAALFVFIALIFHFQLNDLLAVPAFALLILGAARNDGLFRRLMQAEPLQWLGRISYSLYLVHGVVFIALWFVLPWIKTDYALAAFSPLQKLGYLVTFSAMVLAIAQATHSFIEQPTRLWLLALRGEKTHSPA